MVMVSFVAVSSKTSDAAITLAELASDRLSASAADAPNFAIFFFIMVPLLVMRHLNKLRGTAPRK